MATTEQIVARALAMARQGRAESDAMIWEDDVWRLVLPAYQQLGMAVAGDAKTRAILTFTFDVELTQGVVDLSQAAFVTLLRGKLCYASFFDGEDTSLIHPYVFKDRWQDLHKYLSPQFGYFSVRDDKLITRKRGEEDIAQALISTPGGPGAPAKLVAPAVPTTTVPVEAEDKAVSILAAMAIASADQIAAQVV